MAKAPGPDKQQIAEGDPKRGDEILKRMLQSKPKSHEKIVAERKRQGRATDKKR